MSIRSLLTLLATTCLAWGLGAEGWKYTSDASLSLAQGFYSDNWNGTELSNITWVANSNTAAEKQLSKILHDKTTLKLAFGQTHTQKTAADGDKYWEKPDKSTDKIDLESVLKFTLNAFVDPFVAGRMQSQFIDLSQESLDNTRFVNPILFTETAGIAKTIIKQEHENLNSRLGFAFRQNVDRHNWIAADEYETLTTNDGGLDWVTEYDKLFLPSNVSYKSRLQVFQAIFNSKSDELNDDWKSPDLSWEHSLSTKLFSVVTASLYLQLLYEKEQDSAVQLKETLGMGVSWQLF